MSVSPLIALTTDERERENRASPELPNLHDSVRAPLDLEEGKIEIEFNSSSGPDFITVPDQG